MGKAQKKTGKGRLDKYYKLAKEQGYRARSAFKLIQLNKKFSFLETARCCIDLCAAPGGWLQVASKYMPPSSLIVGIDLVPIKAIPRVTTFAADITSPECKNLIRSELKNWKADLVLHDGAPNVGTAWTLDAYGQSELVLMSLKLAVEFLIKGGTFITKIFRSADYNNLIWVFNQLFGKVEATKPPSSRNVSAEIFVVCREFLAPKKLDPKFLDPKHVFKELTSPAPTDGKVAIADNAQARANVFQPDKKRRQRDGYADGQFILFKTSGAGDFIRSSDPVSLLGSVNRITFSTDQEKVWLGLEATTQDVRANCEDLKVLGKGDFKALMKWRSSIRQEIGLDNKANRVEDELTQDVVEIEEQVDEDEAIQNELERLREEAAAKAKREKRKANETKQRTIRRMQLQMTAPLDIGMEQNDAGLNIGQEDVFELSTHRRNRERARLTDDHVQGSDDGESDDEVAAGTNGTVNDLGADLDDLYDSYKQRRNERDAKFKAKEARAKNKDREEWAGFGTESCEDDTDVESEVGGWEEMEAAKDADSSSESDFDSDGEGSSEPAKSNGKRVANTAPGSRKKRKLLTDLNTKPTTATSRWFDQEIFNGIELDDVGEDIQNNGDIEIEDDFEVVPQKQDDDTAMWDNTNEDEMKLANLSRDGLTTAEAVELAQQLVNRQKTTSQLVSDGFSRYSLNSKEGLPSWFLDEEAQYYKPNIPITKEAMDMLRARQRALDARPIKKVAEAKARKKFKAVQKLQKALKKAEGVNDSTDMSEKEKAQQIQKLMKGGVSKAKAKRNSEVKVVVAKGAHKGIKGRPKGVKGRYQMVDARMRKEMRAKKRKEKATKKQ